MLLSSVSGPQLTAVIFMPLEGTKEKFRKAVGLKIWCFLAWTEIETNPGLLSSTFEKLHETNFYIGLRSQAAYLGLRIIFWPLSTISWSYFIQCCVLWKKVYRDGHMRIVQSWWWVIEDSCVDNGEPSIKGQIMGKPTCGTRRRHVIDDASRFSIPS